MLTYTTSKSGHPYPCQNCWLWLSTVRTGRGSLLNRPPRALDNQISQGTDLNRTVVLSESGHWCWLNIVNEHYRLCCQIDWLTFLNAWWFQTRLMNTVESISNKLSYFNEYDTITTVSGSSGVWSVSLPFHSNCCLSEAFIHLNIWYFYSMLPLARTRTWCTYKKMQGTYNR